jgi:anti-sigma factor RsiW
MKCPELNDQFDERLDGRLDEMRAREFDAHVADCAPCRRDWQEYQAMWGLVAKHRTVEPSFGFAQRTLRRLQDAPANARVWFWQLPVFRWATAASLLLIISIGSFVTWQNIQSRRAAEIYAAAHQDRIDDIDVISSLDKLEPDSKL